MQNRRALLFFSLAVLFGLAAAHTAKRLVERSQPEPEQIAIETTPVVVAREGLAVAAELHDGRLAVVEWPTAHVPDGSFSDPAALEGRALRRAHGAGEPILASALLPSGAEASFVSLIRDETRAISVQVDPVIGVAGFVTPGARVDVLATMARSSSDQRTSRVILQDVPVLAIDQKTEEASDGEPELASVVTLEVTPAQAEALVYGAHEGRLQLALRGPTDPRLVKTAGVNAADLLRRERAVRRVSRPSVGVQVLKGADVSVKGF